ncbi:hypothetical protein vseg_017962 [Gypsophila vaccaria]
MEGLSKSKTQAPPPDIWRDSSYDFRHDPATMNSNNDDNDSSEEDGFDFQHNKPDLENQCMSPVCESPINDYGKITPKATPRVSFQDSQELVHRRVSSVGVSSKANDQVLRCSSRAFLTRVKTKSRLMDLPPCHETTARSGRTETEEDDPFEDDLPEEFKKTKLSLFTVVQWISLILIVTALVCNLVIKKWRGKTVWGLQLWKWEVMGLVLICGGLLSGWLIRIVVFLIERNTTIRKKVLYFVFGLKNSVQMFLYLGLVLLAWILILDKSVAKETNSQVLPYVTKILICFMVATLLWFIKTLLLKVLAMNFHVSAFFDRIQDALFNQYVIETLSGLPYVELRRVQEEADKVMCEVSNKFGDNWANCVSNEERVVLEKGKPIGKSRWNSIFGKSRRKIVRSPCYKKEEGDSVGISIDQLHRLNQKNVSAWNMKKLMSVVRKGVLSTLDGQLDAGIEDDNALQIRSEKEAKCASKRVFTNVARQSSRHIYFEDLTRFLREDEASRTIRLFEGAGDGKGISKRALKNWVVNVFRERRALALSLNDTKTAVNKLNHLVNILVGVVIIIIWLLILGVPITHFLIFVSSQVVVLAFMFGNTCKTTFEAIIFLFVMHPFDVGDRCEIDGVQMVVEEMNILTTVFLRFDNQKIIYPNSVLATKPISNYYRSPDMGDSVDFCVHISTPVEKISLMKERIIRYIENKNEHWYPAPMVVMRDVEDMNKITFSVWLSHTMNHQDMGERWARRALLVEEMVRIFRDLDVEYRMLPLDVNVRNMPPLVSDIRPSNWAVCAR